MDEMQQLQHQPPRRDVDDVDEQRMPAEPVDGAETCFVREVRHVAVLNVDAEVRAGEEQEQPGDEREVVR